MKNKITRQKREKIIKDNMPFMVEFIITENVEYINNSVYELSIVNGKYDLKSIANVFDDKISPELICLKIIHNLAMVNAYCAELQRQGGNHHKIKSLEKKLYLKIKVTAENVLIIEKKGFGMFGVWNIDDMAYALNCFSDALKEFLEIKLEDYNYLKIILKDYSKYSNISKSVNSKLLTYIEENYDDFLEACSEKFVELMIKEENKVDDEEYYEDEDIDEEYDDNEEDYDEEYDDNEDDYDEDNAEFEESLITDENIYLAEVIVLAELKFAAKNIEKLYLGLELDENGIDEEVRAKILISLLLIAEFYLKTTHNDSEEVDRIIDVSKAKIYYDIVKNNSEEEKKELMKQLEGEYINISKKILSKDNIRINDVISNLYEYLGKKEAIGTILFINFCTEYYDYFKLVVDDAEKNYNNTQNEE